MSLDNNTLLARRLNRVLRTAARREQPTLELKGANLLVTRNQKTTTVSLASSTQIESTTVGFR